MANKNFYLVAAALSMDTMSSVSKSKFFYLAQVDTVGVGVCYTVESGGNR